MFEPEREWYAEDPQAARWAMSFAATLAAACIGIWLWGSDVYEWWRATSIERISETARTQDGLMDNYNASGHTDKSYANEGK